MKNLTELLQHEVQDLYSAENQLVGALPKMEEAATDPGLKSAFREHLAETKGHVTRLEEAAKHLGIDPEGETCEAMQGLIAEGEEIAQIAEPSVRDAALIAAGQRVEHYEMAGYGSAAAFAEQTGHREVQDLLAATLQEETSADATLNKIARGGKALQGVNAGATA
ncbi:MAG: ferritin-like domain-containing protein [Opitutales bacterium]